MERMGAAVEKRVYAGMGHTVNDDEVRYIRHLLKSVVDPR